MGIVRLQFLSLPTPCSLLLTSKYPQATCKQENLHVSEGVCRSRTQKINLLFQLKPTETYNTAPNYCNFA